MFCVSTCLLGFAFLGAMVFCMIKTKDSTVFKRFDSLLTEEQKKIHNEIKQERARIYLQGMALGLVLSFVVLMKSKTAVKGMLSRVCLFLFVGLGTAYMYYSLMPKSKWMLDHLTTPEQSSAWLDIYQEMKRRHYLGLLLGIVGYVLVGKSMCK